ncbi:gliding motility protein GldM [Cytophagaceae bacterium DM2B3-1]|uniref:Gliding motility protein GldM n=1 Tax=Xanthocytophaga flava TaxID=3048013 RepID=A0AAE3QXK9_9BACT|nr:gliding motility protein GldM [Xanthocytophaga flavus]MDJ1468263.1 gliding motility protein GldM [Xanthocytophaga flavus]MDJ1485293.1 gliding motility protein GldM [Xanthocytophaga flavus]MDJ1494630.1 gliding motility protein GldM [Xanthocytophaga flavus]
MAGGKETVRQKMVGMMYLVLTALLALQVSSEIVKKFELINTSLEQSTSAAESNNDKMVEAIAKEATGDKAKVLTAAKEVKERTSKALAALEEYKKSLIAATGGINPENNQFKNPNGETDVESLMIGAEGAKNGKGYEMRKLIEDHVASINSVAKTNFPSLTLDAKDVNGLKDDEAQKNKDFVELNFQATPMVAALAVISQKQSEIARYEAEALKKLAADLNVGVIKFDKIVAMVRPEARTIAAGTSYKAEMFLAASSSGITPSMTFNGRGIPVSNGMGKVDFKASASNYDKEGKSKQTWKGTISFRSPSGKDTAFSVTEEYTVVKPVIQVQSQSVNALYANCGNELKFTVPALGADYRPSFSVSGGSHFTGANIGDITIVPTGTQVAVTVSSGGATIGTENFKVRPVPKPAMKVFSNGRELDTKRGLSAPYPNSLEIRLVPDEGFANLLPKDARFKATSTEVYLVRGSRPVGSAKGDDRLSLGGLVSQMRAGDRLVIEVKDVKRMNFKGQLIESGIAGSTIVSASLN